VGPRAGWDAVEKKILGPTGTRTPTHAPIVSRYTYCVIPDSYIQNSREINGAFVVNCHILIWCLLVTSVFLISFMFFYQVIQVL
jgi:hypothetical protein